MHPKDRDHIDKAISASREVLERATAMLVEGRLRYAPRRTRVCIISASTLLLKAISLGGSAHDLKVKMGKLDQCIAALRLCGIDDLDFLSRYGELIEQHLQRFRDQFILLPDCGGPDQPGEGSTAVEPTGDDWKVRPFDPRIAPWKSDSKAIPLGISFDSLDFLL
ncbi:uncharacterized protein N7473_005542 [Penicillium subrubescens]|uniref:Uncharacterized protein n=1 Tax=Penicillium subrubescens TaxID=1316194 RepID=A0A1Q5T605_9EURO|nr:uncharacterized protein N7473_005542 [Penicillium subrubescens]KAJ5896143.1 hypothetical protein N7473_005542 [Penicillium subrubescens]OKO95663.1 hypothetical protein PENSUB_11175 [Penicillium subrubescens]